VTSTGHPQAFFRRAIAAGNLIAAEAGARELGQLTLEDALDLTLLIARRDPRRYPRAARRWLERFVVETEAPVEIVQLAAAALSAGPPHGENQLRALTQWQERGVGVPTRPLPDSAGSP
jgi:hypothetical protein